MDKSLVKSKKTKPDNRLRDAIAAARTDEDKSAVLVVAGDQSARTLCVAWPSVPIKLRKPQRACPKDANKRWAWIWESADLDIGTMMRCSGLIERVCIDAFEKLRMNQLIYPDGTLHASAQRMIQIWLDKEMGDDVADEEAGL